MNLIAFKVNFHNQRIRHRALHRPTHGVVAFRLTCEAVNVTAIQIRHGALSLTLIAWINLSTLTAAAPLRISPVKSPILSDCSRCLSAWSRISWLLSSLVMYTLLGSPQAHGPCNPPRTHTQKKPTFTEKYKQLTQFCKILKMFYNVTYQYYLYAPVPYSYIPMILGIFSFSFSLFFF